MNAGWLRSTIFGAWGANTGGHLQIPGLHLVHSISFTCLIDGIESLDEKKLCVERQRPIWGSSSSNLSGRCRTVTQPTRRWRLPAHRARREHARRGGEGRPRWILADDYQWGRRGWAALPHVPQRKRGHRDAKHRASAREAGPLDSVPWKHRGKHSSRRKRVQRGGQSKSKFWYKLSFNVKGDSKEE